MSYWAKIWRANPNISDELLNELMLAPHNTPATSTPPTTPTNLVASVNGLGVVTLRWGRNGNNSGTIFNVEVAETGAGPWTIFDSTTKTRMEYQAALGSTVWFRVVAKRDGQSATPTNGVAIWTGESSFGNLSVAA